MTEDLILRPMVAGVEKAFYTALDSWDLAEGFLFAQGYSSRMSFLEYLELLKANERGEKLLPGYVPATVLSGFVGNILVGRLSIRHKLNEFLLKQGGHIGYGVLPNFRKKGFARQMLTQALPVARALQIEKVLLTCDDNNLGSIKVIEWHGGKLENKVEIDPSKPLKRRYWIG